MVEEIVLASRADDRVLLNHAITEASEAVGLTLDRSLPSPKSSHLQDDSSVAVARSTQRNQETLRDLSTKSFRQPSVCHNNSGRFSPRLDYGMWIDPDRFVRIIEPPEDIRPYVGSKKHTVAGRIAWACLDYGYACLQEAMMYQMSPRVLAAEHVNDDDDVLFLSIPSDSACRRLFNLSLRHSKPLHDIEYILALVEARMEFRNMGYMRSNTRGSDEISRQVMQDCVLNGLRARGVRMEKWWTALDIEVYIQQRMGILEFSSFQAALYDEQAPQTELMMPLAQTLAHQGVCFGDGPRWNAANVMTLVDAWIRHISDCSDYVNNVIEDGNF